MLRHLLAAAALAASVTVPAHAHFWRHGGWGGVVILGPPVYFAVPAYPYGYGPPPGYSYAPPPRMGEGCYAGPYVCPLDQPGPVGAPCSCPTSQGRAWGRIG